MAKVVRWRGQFADIENKQYTVDIYGEQVVGVGVKEITLGANPLITDEDDSDDPMEKGRGITGTIEIIDDNNGDDIYELLPSDNIDRPVEISCNGNIVWRGFIACEAHTIDYTNRVKSVSLSVISILQAMDSVEINQDPVIEFAAIYKQIAYCMRSFNTKVGIIMATDLYADDKWGYGFYKNLYGSIFFKKESVVNGDTVRTEVHSDSIKTILEKIAGIFCCHVVEKNGKVYFAPNFGKSYSYNHCTYLDLLTYLDGWQLERTFVNSRTLDMREMEYVSDDHTLSITQGARRVKVIASLEQPQIEFGIPECPTTDIQEHEKAQKQGMYMLANMNDYANEYVSFGQRYMAYMLASYDIENLIKSIRPLTMQEFRVSYMNGMSWWTAYSSARKWYFETQQITQQLAFFAGAVLAKFISSDVGDVTIPDHTKSEDGLYLALLPFSGTMIKESVANMINPIVTLKSKDSAIMTNGYIHINTDSLGFYDGYPSDSRTYNTIIATQEIYGYIWCSLRVGQKYWDGMSWQDSPRARFPIYYDTEKKGDKLVNPGKFAGNWNPDMGIEERSGFLIPVENMSGDVAISIWPVAEVGHGSFDKPVFEIFMRDLDVEYVPKKDVYMSGKSANEYTLYTGKNYQDTVDVSIDLATDFNNLPATNMLYENGSTPVRLIQIGSDAGRLVRPEVDMLEQMKVHYSSPRRIITLNVSPLEADTPMIRVTGYDGKTYVPVSESRDWRMNKSTIKMIETE